jgi:hypothetical protein
VDISLQTVKNSGPSERKDVQGYIFKYNFRTIRVKSGIVDVTTDIGVASEFTTRQ